MLTKFTNTLMNGAIGDYLVNIEYNNILEVSCRDEKLEAEHPLALMHGLGTVFNLDISLSDEEKTMTIPFPSQEDRQFNQDVIFHNALDVKYKDLHKGFYSKPIAEPIYESKTKPVAVPVGPINRKSE